MLDPVKEINAEVMACANGFSTHEDSALRLNGSDFSANVEQLIREQTQMSELMEVAPVQPEETDEEETNDNDETAGSDEDKEGNDE
jgi:capsid protein